MTSFDYIIIPTCGNWFQTNPLHSINWMIIDSAGNTVSSVCVTNGKDDRHFSSKFDQHLSLYCGSSQAEFQTGLGYGEANLLVMISKIYWQFWHTFFKYTCGSSYNFLFHWNNVEKNGMFSLFDISVNGSVTFVCILMFHCTSAYMLMIFHGN